MRAQFRTTKVASVRQMQWAGLLTCVLPLIFVFLSINDALKTRAFLRDAREAQGTVVAVSYHNTRNSKGQTVRSAVSEISYEVGGMAYQFMADSDQGRGAKVSILYQTSNPGSARLNRFSSLWGASLVGILVGGGFSILGAYIFLSARKRSKELDYLLLRGRECMGTIVGFREHATHRRGTRRNGRLRSYTLCVQAQPPTGPKSGVIDSDPIGLLPGRVEQLLQTQVRVFFDPRGVIPPYVDVEGLSESESTISIT